MIQQETYSIHWGGLPDYLKIFSRRESNESKTVSRAEDTRCYERLRTAFDGTICGPDGMIEMSGVDMHHYGAGIRCRHQLEVGSVVFVHFKSLKLMGFAFVRHCSKRKRFSRYFVGLEFRSPLLPEERARWHFQHIRETNAAAWTY